MYWLLVALLLPGCAALKKSESATVPSASPSPQVATSPAPPAVTDRPAPSADQKEQAALFDRFLNQKLSAAQQKSYLDACAKDGKFSPFCFAVINFETLEAKLHPKAEPHPKKPRVRPRFSEGKVTNWSELKGDSLSHLIRSMAHLKDDRLEILKKAALSETQCPNNAAVAVAATLEDSLPDEVDPAELAALYEKGGDCLSDPDNKESILTRAGLFYYMKKDVAKAVAVWQRSAAVEAAKSPSALYWLYRVQIDKKDKTGAQATLAKLREKFPFSFHTVMARLYENQEPDDILDREAPATLKRSKILAVVNSLVEEAELLRDTGFTKSAAKVLDWAIADSSQAEPEFRLYLVELKEEMEEMHSAIFLLSKVLIDHPAFVSRRTLFLFYPKAFLPLFVKHAEGLDPYLLLSIARQESAFNAKAVSSARAKGLLQVVGRRVRKKGQNLFDPESNIRAGAKLIAQMVQDNEGSLQLALSAYNAGPRRAATWAKRYPVTDPILFIDLIPYKETRAYVALILRNYYWYRRIYNPAGDERLPWVGLSPREQALWPHSPSVASAVKSAPAGLPSLPAQ